MVDDVKTCSSIRIWLHGLTSLLFRSANGRHKIGRSLLQNLEDTYKQSWLSGDERRENRYVFHQGTGWKVKGFVNFQKLQGGRLESGLWRKITVILTRMLSPKSRGFDLIGGSRYIFYHEYWAGRGLDLLNQWGILVCCTGRWSSTRYASKKPGIQW